MPFRHLARLLLAAYDLFRKPVSTFRDHALARAERTDRIIRPEDRSLRRTANPVASIEVAAAEIVDHAQPELRSEVANAVEAGDPGRAHIREALGHPGQADLAGGLRDHRLGEIVEGQTKVPEVVAKLRDDRLVGLQRQIHRVAFPDDV